MVVDIPEHCIDRAHRIEKKTPDRVIPIIVRFTARRHRTMVHHKWNHRVNCRITLDLTKSRMGILKEVIDLTWESILIHFLFRTWRGIQKLKKYTVKIFEWFHNNWLKSNAGKCNLITSSTSPVEIQIENTIISSVKRVKLLGVHIDGRLDFDYHVNQIC